MIVFHELKDFVKKSWSMLVSKHFHQRRIIQGGVGFSPIVVSVQSHLKFGNQIWEVIICVKYRCVKQRLVVDFVLCGVQVRFVTLQISQVHY